jgi:hypothetical protein
MNDDELERIRKGLQAVFRERSHEGLSEEAIQRIVKSARLIKVRKLDAAQVRTLTFETIASRFATGAAMLALAVFVYGKTEGVGLTSMNDIYPKEMFQFFIARGGIL